MIEKSAIITEFEDAGLFLSVLETAKKWGLAAEFVMFFLRSVREGKTVAEAVEIARGEWDF